MALVDECIGWMNRKNRKQRVQMEVAMRETANRAGITVEELAERFRILGKGGVPIENFIKLHKPAPGGDNEQQKQTVQGTHHPEKSQRQDRTFLVDHEPSGGCSSHFAKALFHAKRVQKTTGPSARARWPKDKARK